MENNKNGNILLVASLTGFVRAFLMDDIQILQSMGYKVCCAANGNIDDRSLEENQKMFHERNVTFYNISFSSNNPFSKLNLTAYQEICRILKTNSFDAIHIHTPIPGVICRIAAMRYQNNCKVLYTTHGFYFHKKSSKKSWLIFYTIEKFMSNYCDAIITINKEDFNNAKKMHCKQVYYINGVGVNTDRYTEAIIDREEYRKKLGIKEEEIALLAVGELSTRKNHQIIIRAMSLINEYRLVYIICGKAIEGEGTYSELKKLADELKVNVRFFGYRTDIPQLAKAVDIGTIPSSREGLGLAGIEMLAAGLPLVASNVHGINDYVIDGETGFSASPYSEKEFAEIIMKLSKKQIRMSMMNDCVKKAKEFDMKISHMQRSEIYNNVLK